MGETHRRNSRLRGVGAKVGAFGLLLAGVTVGATLLPTTSVSAQGTNPHPGVPVYGAPGGDPTGQSCSYVDFTYTDGHKDGPFLACGNAATNDLTPNVGGSGLPLHVRELHASCSDVFSDGGVPGKFGKGDPRPSNPAGHSSADYEHFVSEWRIIKYKDYGTAKQKIDKDCGRVEAPTYVCVGASGVTATAATVEGRTNNVNATRAVFTFTPGGAVFESTSPVSSGNNRTFTVNATGLTPNTGYTVTVQFFAGATSLGTSAAGCPFTTSPESTPTTAPPTTAPPTTAPPTTAPPTTAPPTTPPGAPGAPGISIIKFVNDQDANVAPGVFVAAGSTLTFRYDVTNTGAVRLTNVTVTDRLVVGGTAAVAVSCPSTVLDPGARMSCTASGPAPASGQYTNVGRVTGDPPSGPSVGAEDPANAFAQTPAPAVDIIKSVNGADANTAPGLEVGVGAALTWTYSVTNIGNVALSNVTVTDDKGVAIDCGTGSHVIPLLDVGGTRLCVGYGTATVVGLYTNIGTVTGTPPTGPAVTDSDPANHTAVEGVLASVLPPPQLPPGTLPATGPANAGIAWAALGLLGFGAALILATRRRTASTSTI